MFQTSPSGSSRASGIRQILQAPVVVSGPLADTSGNYSSPFQNLDLFSRFDFNLPHGARAFLRGNYDSLKDVAAYGGSNYSPFPEPEQYPSTGGGLDFLTGPFSHSIRIGYFKFVNHISDATAGGGIYNPTPGINLVIDHLLFRRQPAGTANDDPEQPPVPL